MMVAAEKRHTPELRFGGFSEEWAQKTGAEITDKITKGSSPTWQGFEYTKQGVLFVTSENVRDGFLDVSKPKYLPVEFYDKQKNSSLRFGDILINIVGASIGRCCLYSRNERAFTNQAVALFRVKESNSIDFVAYCYQQSRIQKIISGTQSESARPNLSLTDLRELQFNIPSPSEQQKIAAFLGAVDNKLTA
ncbi:MAG: restriction endonuclease subunit S, partial [Desulfuromonadales bacterium]|nr:restriction endonuclease subunit S [Desulfuromonadales bacterium]